MKKLLITVVCIIFLSAPLMTIAATQKNFYKINITNMCKFNVAVISLNSKWISPITSINIKPGKTYTFEQRLNSGKVNLAVSDPSEIWGKISFDNGQYKGYKNYKPQSSYFLLFNKQKNNLIITSL
ncbi:MAG: hypothetical protein GY756_19375 [bacterium]|nr:hypothetical protein [bacterium]